MEVATSTSNSGSATSDEGIEDLLASVAIKKDAVACAAAARLYRVTHRSPPAGRATLLLLRFSDDRDAAQVADRPGIGRAAVDQGAPPEADAP